MQLNEIVVLTVDQSARETFREDNLYEISDYPVGGITNAQMAQALNPTYNQLYHTGDCFICVDSGTYTKGRAYRFTGTAWAEITEFDTAPTENSGKPVTSGGVYTALAGKQAALTFDSEPTQNSTNPVTSGGVKSYVDGIVGDINSVLENVL